MQLTTRKARELVTTYGSPLYVYDSMDIRTRARKLKNLSLPYGLTARYAIKANPHPEIIRLIAREGLQFDASSSYEAELLLNLGIPASAISLSSQQPAHNLESLLKKGISFVATSMRQLELFTAESSHPKTVGLRVNPGMGSGHSNRLTTGGRAASFGLWYEYLPDALTLAKQHRFTIDRLHVHVGTGGDVSKWGEIMDVALSIAAKMPDVTQLDIGGGFKIAYTDSDIEAHLEQIADTFSKKISAFADTTGRKLGLEIEPGRWLVAHSGHLLTEIVDIVNTGADGFTFLRTNTGMNDFMRPAMYGAQHNVRVLNDNKKQAEYVVVGHCCETSDVLTPAPHDPERIVPRSLNTAAIGDLLSVSDAGAYCSAMSTKGYNAFPQAKEVFLSEP